MIDEEASIPIYVFEKPKAFPSVENFGNGIIFLSKTNEKLLLSQ